jgi:uncharacterized protein with PIN domain
MLSQSIRSNQSSREPERTRLPLIGPRASSASSSGRFQLDSKQDSAASSSRDWGEPSAHKSRLHIQQCVQQNLIKEVRSDKLHFTETHGHHEDIDSCGNESLPSKFKKPQVEETLQPKESGRSLCEPMSAMSGFEHEFHINTVEDPEAAQFLREMQKRYNAAAVSERQSSSRQRAREGSEAVIAFDLIVQAPISENDPALATYGGTGPRQASATSRRQNLPPTAERREPPAGRNARDIRT